METSTKIILLMIMYGLPLCLAIIYRINKNKKLNRSMITENEVSDVIGEEFPEINNELRKTVRSNIYKVLIVFVNYTKKCADAGNINKLKSCFLIADKLITKGNNAVKSAVENVYVFSISPIIEVVSPFQDQINKIFPENLKNAYQKQIMTNYS